MNFNKKPVNSLNLEFLQELVSTLDKLEKDKECRGLIIKSNNPGVFCAGLDIMEMYQPNTDRLRQFWTAVQEMWIRFYGSNLITMAAINGHSPAGGCLMALTADYRVMASGQFTIGLNETHLGIVAPIWFQWTMKNTIGHRETEYALQLGRLFTGPEALEVGLIDELVPADQVMAAAEKEMDVWLRIPDMARQATKWQLRQPTLEHLTSRRKEDVDVFVKFITKSAIQNLMGKYLEKMKMK